jgi:ArsR family transcriptional regulator
MSTTIPANTLDDFGALPHHFIIPTSERMLPSEAECAVDEHPRRGRTAPAGDAALEMAAGLFRAAGDPARLRLLEHLSGGEACVSELAAHLGANMSAVSQQLRVLRGERLVVRRRAGKHVFYALADQHIANLVLSALAHAAEEES